jgi:hypothetical protein
LKLLFDDFAGVGLSVGEGDVAEVDALGFPPNHIRWCLTNHNRYLLKINIFW